MKTHAEVHEAVEGLISGTRLTEFMVTTKSWRAEDGSIAVEWGCCISSGRRHPEFYFSVRDPDTLIANIRDGIDRRRSEFRIYERALDSLRGAPPKSTAPAEHFDPTGEFPR